MRLIDTSRFFLKGTQNRFIHLATVHHGVREFMCFADKCTNKTYIEEITGGSLVFIEDDSLAQGIADFLTRKGVLEISKPTLPDDQWLKR